MTKVKSSLQEGFGLVGIIILVLVVTAVCGVGVFVHSKIAEEAAPSASEKTARMVTSAPFDFEQIGGISKFRSCSGHDYSGKDIDGQVETLRSMKNYVASLPSLAGKKDTIKLYAPFDGVVIGNKIGKLDYNFDMMPESDQHWVYELGHVSTPTIKVGDHLKSGQFIGYFNQDKSFDVQFWYGGKKTVNTLERYLDSLFAHMTPELENTFAKYGLTPANLVVSKDFRDSNACKLSGDVKLDSAVFAGTFSDDYTLVKNKASVTYQELQSSGDLTGAAASNTTTTPPANQAVDAECAASVPVSERPPGCSQ